MRVKENVKFHLYISQAPCGDASIFPSNPLQGMVGDKCTSGNEMIASKSYIHFQSKRLKRRYLREQSDNTMPTMITLSLYAIPQSLANK